MNFRMSEEQYQKHQEAVQRARRVDFREPLPQLSAGVKPAGLVPTHLVTAAPASPSGMESARNRLARSRSHRIDSSVAQIGPR